MDTISTFLDNKKKSKKFGYHKKKKLKIWIFLYFFGYQKNKVKNLDAQICINITHYIRIIYTFFEKYPNYQKFKCGNQKFQKIMFWYPHYSKYFIWYPKILYFVS